MSSPSMVKAKLVLALCASLFLASTTAAQKYNAVYSFGDSITDTGNLCTNGRPSAITFTQPPYGETYFGKPTCRCSDGRVIVDFLSDKFGLPFLPPSKSTSADFKKGANMAITGATAMDAPFFRSLGLSDKIWNNGPISFQIQWFQQITSAVCGTSCKSYLAKSLFVFGEFGGNDYNAMLFGNYNSDQASTYTPQIISTIGDGVEKLIALGATDIVVPGVLPIGCFPIYHSLFLSLGSNDTAAAHLRALTARPHLAGTEANAVAAEHVVSTLSSLSFPTRVTPYSVLLSYPAHRSLSLSAPGRATTDFALVQDTYPDDPNAAVSAEVVPTFLAYSASGSAAAEAVYANYGRAEDYAYLASRGINVTGKVAIARYGKVYRGDKVRNARVAGAAAAVIYTDYKDYTPGKAFPDGPWMPPTGVQVGSTFKGVGDPTTPMWASSEGCERVSIAEAMATDDMPGIPALPVSGRDGEEIIQLIGGDVAPEDWQGGEGAPVYRLGPGPAVLNLTYAGNETMATIQNVIAVIEGKEEPDRYVILGNHRDAWTFGAVDPNSGTAALLELAERLSKLQYKGWRPRRTIILCNWDAEEYGLIGSTEWVEENRAMLTSRTVAYLNVDIGVCNSGVDASATPQLDALLKQASKQVPNPDNGTESLYDMWMASDSTLIGRLGGGGSDYSAFVQHIGIPSVDMSIGSDYAVYHSLYDDFTWMEKYGDPMFRRHVAVASMWGLLALRLSDEEILPFNYSSYVTELENGAVGINERVLGMPVSLSPLHKSIKEFDRAVLKVDSELKALQTRKVWSPWRNNPLKVRDLNDRLMMTERAFTEREGLSGRPWYKHMIYGPSLYNDYGAEVYPGVDDAIQTAKRTNTSESWQSVQHEIHRIARVISQAALVLGGGLT